ncbi:MAG: hypothetical protein FWD66_01045 [Paludibacter sp.]|nr:hypothetical protein [Paludibacter sp.]
MTYIQVLEKMIERKQVELKVISNEVSSLPDNFNKRKFIELGAELKILETCIDLAKVMFDNENGSEDKT